MDDGDRLLDLMPASYQTDPNHDLAPWSLGMSCLERELDLERLDRIFGCLWLVGRPMPPRPLHYQLYLGRDIVVTERMDMHLTWTDGRIFLKPVPRFLLEPRFWTAYLSCNRVRPNCPCSTKAQCPLDRSGTDCAGRRRLGAVALGFLFSYAALIRHESDFCIAQERRLLPAEVRWVGWRILVRQLDIEHIYPRISRRFLYGELRLSRLNKIYRLTWRPLFLRPYVTHWHRYGGFFADHFAWLAGATVYMAVVLTAMQVGLATERLGKSDAFQLASYGFSVFSILGPLVVAVLLVLAAGCMFVDNLVETLRFSKKRLLVMRGVKGLGG
jgi:hypothetical protein